MNASPVTQAGNAGESDERVDEVLREHDTASRFRTDLGWWGWLVGGLSVALTLFHLYTAVTGSRPTIIQGAIHVGAAVSIIFLLYPAHKKPLGPATGDAVLRIMAQLMGPMVPHLAEDVWALAGGEGLLVDAPWPEADPNLLVSNQVTLPIQINGKRRGEITVPTDMAQAEVEQAVLADETVQKFLNGQPPKKLIVVPGRIVNVVA